MKNMEIIGSGFQYRTLLCSSTRVYKEERPYLIRFIKAFLFFGKFNAASKLRFRLIRSALRVRILTAKKDFDHTLFGNIEFHGLTSFFQDYAITPKEYFKKNSLERNKKIVDAYIQSLFELWGYGLSENIFKPTLNSGILGDRVIFTDIGEITNSFEQTKKAIEVKAWHKDVLLRIRDMDSRLRAYYLRQMDEHITLDNLRLYWCNKV